MGRCIAVEGNCVRRLTLMLDRFLEEGLFCGYIPVSC
jgi:hypothetical protein